MYQLQLAKERTDKLIIRIGVVPAKKRSHSRGDGALLAIAVFKFIKGAVLLALALGALSFLHKDVASEVEHWIDQLRIGRASRALHSCFPGFLIRIAFSRD